MPGTIQVSVLGLVDLPSSPKSSTTGANPGNFLSLKMAIGKTEYQTMGEGEFSFPVTSLCENLIVTVHDMEGNEISRTDVKTMLVVEKRFLDALVPLQGGGCILLKLQFLLSEEERKRIHKMRESAMKRKHGELLETGLRHSASEETMIGPASRRIIELREGDLRESLALTAPDESGDLLASALLQEPQEHPDDSSDRDVPLLTEVNEKASENQLCLHDAHKTHASLEEVVDTQSECLQSLVSGNLTVTSSSPGDKSREDRTDSPKEKNMLEKTAASNVKKMISTFESNSFQGLKPHVGSMTKSQLTKITARGPFLEEVTTMKIKVGQTMPKSYSAGMLSEIDLQSVNVIHAKKQEKEKHSDLAIGGETIGRIKQLVELKKNQNNKNLDPGKRKAVSKFSYTTQSPSCEGDNDVLEPIKTNEMVNSGGLGNNAGERQNRLDIDVKKSSTVTSHEALKDKDALDSFPECYPLDSPSLYTTSGMPLSSFSGKNMEILGPKQNLVAKINKRGDGILEDHGADLQAASDYSQSFDGRQLVHSNELEKDEGALVNDDRPTAQVVTVLGNTEQISSLKVHQRGFAPNVIRGESGCLRCGDDPDELTACGILNAKLDLLIYADMEQCLFGSHGSWMPRHLCITTASRKLRDFIKGSNIHTGTCADEPLARVNLEEEHMMPEDICPEVIQDEKIKDSKSERFGGTSKFKGGLIEQAVRVVIVLVACGTVLFNTRGR